MKEMPDGAIGFERVRDGYYIVYVGLIKIGYIMLTDELQWKSMFSDGEIIGTRETRDQAAGILLIAYRRSNGL